MSQSRSVHELDPADVPLNTAAELHDLVFRCVHTMAIPDWLQLQLTISQLKGLFTIATYGSLSIGELARRLGVSLPTASTLVEALVGLGYVSRHEDGEDRRRTLTRLTIEGETLVGRLQLGRQQMLRESLGRLGADELASLVRGLRALVRELDPPAPVRLTVATPAASQRTAPISTKGRH
jgi:DNA-binding MarR family transcriptional regulator